MLRAAIVGAMTALILALSVVVLVATGALDVFSNAQPPERLLIIATVPDEDGSEAAAVAFVLSRGSASPVFVDVDATVTVPGTSASSPRMAYAFGGGDAVAVALKTQTGGDVLQWVALPSDVWSDLVDQAGGMRATVPTGVSAYRNGSLVLVESGLQELNGLQAVALASGASFLPPDLRESTTRALQSGLYDVVGAASVKPLDQLLAEGRATGSLSVESASAFFEGF